MDVHLLRHSGGLLDDLRLRDGADQDCLSVVAAGAAQVEDGDDALLRSRVEDAARVVHLDLDEGVLLVQGRAHERGHQEGEPEGKVEKMQDDSSEVGFLNQDRLVHRSFRQNNLSLKNQIISDRLL